MSDSSEASGFIDAHCHLSDERVFSESLKFIDRAQQAGVRKIMLGGVEPKEWNRQIELRKQCPGVISTSFGLHPWWIEKLSDEEIAHALSRLRVDAVEANAIGETGLDFHSKRDPARFKAQRATFLAQVEIAQALKKPLVLHVVKAHAEALSILKSAKFTQPLMVHSFSGSVEEAREWMKLGALLSFSGGVLVPGKFMKAKEVIQTVPLHHLLLETDAPDQAWRDGLNEPSLIPELYQGVASLLGVKVELLTQKLAENFRVFC
jgi:TatD DNase family protein